MKSLPPFDSIVWRGSATSALQMRACLAKALARLSELRNCGRAPNEPLRSYKNTAPGGCGGLSQNNSVPKCGRKPDELKHRNAGDRGGEQPEPTLTSAAGTFICPCLAAASISRRPFSGWL